MSAAIGAISDQALEPGPAFADRRNDSLSTGAVGDVSGGEIEHEQWLRAILKQSHYLAASELAVLEWTIWPHGKRQCSACQEQCERRAEGRGPTSRGI